MSNQTNNDMLSVVIDVSNPNEYNSQFKREVPNTTNPKRFDCKFEGKFTDEDLLSCRLGQGVSGADMKRFAQHINAQQDDGAKLKEPAVVSDESIYEPIKIGTDNFCRPTEIENKSMKDGKVVIDKKWITYVTLSTGSPRKAIDTSGFKFSS
tara:strand:+ start:38 stop:493 length:456 start_codon:yes stop_codon:yes gene_type:complete